MTYSSTVGTRVRVRDTFAVRRGARLKAMKNSKKRRHGKHVASPKPAPLPATNSVSLPDAKRDGDRRSRSRGPDAMRLFDDEAATALRAQLAALAEDLVRSRDSESIAALRAEHLAASLAEMQRALEIAAPVDPVTAPPAPTPPAADAAASKLAEDESTAALRAQLAMLAAELETSRLAEALATHQAELLATTLADARRSLETIAPPVSRRKRRAARRAN
jgi:hypothetical protein